MLSNYLESYFYKYVGYLIITYDDNFNNEKIPYLLKLSVDSTEGLNG